jgi:hypothetical protein
MTNTWIARLLKKRNSDSSLGINTLKKKFEIRSFNITVYRASTGMVIETSINNAYEEADHVRLHIVPDGEDLGQRLNNIILMENLKV